VAVPHQDLLRLLEVGHPTVRDEQDDRVVVFGALCADVLDDVVEHVAVSGGLGQLYLKGRKVRANILGRRHTVFSSLLYGAHSRAETRISDNLYSDSSSFLFNVQSTRPPPTILRKEYLDIFERKKKSRRLRILHNAFHISDVRRQRSPG
jgi:hypothetical protein